MPVLPTAHMLCSGQLARAIRLAAFSLGLLIAGLFVCLSAPPAFSAGPTYAPSNISVDTVWTLDGSPYVAGPSLTVQPGVSLTIEPGVAVKMLKYTSFTVNGVLNAVGTEAQRITFTSYSDDEAGGDTNNDGSVTNALYNAWGYIYFAPGSSGALSYADLRYGGNNFPKPNYQAQLIIEEAAPALSHLSITKGGSLGFGWAVSLWNTNVTIQDSYLANDIAPATSSGYGIIIYGGQPTILNNEITGNKQAGIALASSPQPTGTIVVQGNSIHDNGQVGSSIRYGLANFTSVTVDARDNWWGSDTGPQHPDNPGGTGQDIYGPVLFDPWVGKENPNNPPVLSYPTEIGFESDGVNPSISYLPDQPTFKVVYTDADDNPPSYIRVVIDGTPYAMVTDSGQDGDFTNGEKYSFTPDSGTFTKGIHRLYFEASDGILAVRLPEIGDNLFEIRNTPVILVPGILATEFKKGDSLVWYDLLQTYFSILDDHLNPLKVDVNGFPIDSEVLVSDVILKKEALSILPDFDYFAGLISSLNSVEYYENEDLYIFPYDWRLDVRLSADELQEKIDVIRAVTGSERVDVIAHSLGGLVVKQYVQSTVNEGTEHHIRKLVFVGTPHLGAPKALKVLLYGDSFGYFALSMSKMKELAHDMFSAYQLLPSKEYVNMFGSYYYDSQGLFGGPVPLNYEQVNSLLTNNGYNVSAVMAGETVHNMQDQLNLNGAGVEVYNVVACSTPTISKIVKLNEFFSGLLHREYSIDVDYGDETVPLVSATAVNTLPGRTYYYYHKDGVHARLPSQSGVRELIARVISGTIGSLSLPNGFTQDKDQCALNGKLYSIHSPVDLDVYDTLGRHSGLGENNSVEIEIPGALYEELEGNKFIFLPSGEEYLVQLMGRGEGTFNLRVKNIVDGVVQDTAYFNEISVSNQSIGRMVVTDTSADDLLEFDYSGTGTFEVIPASSVLDAEQSQDITKPNTSFEVTGVTGDNGWYKSIATVTLTAVDDNSGVLKTEYSVNGAGSWNVYDLPLVISKEGVTPLSFRSTDRAGNVEEIKTVELKIDFTPPGAKMVFDPYARDIVITGVDNLSQVTVLESGTEVTLTDEAGNITVLTFKERNRRQSMSASLTKVEYNGVESDITRLNVLGYRWTYNRRGELQSLLQWVFNRGSYALLATYNNLTKKTIVIGRDVDSDRIRSRYIGLVLLGVHLDSAAIMRYEIIENN